MVDNKKVAAGVAVLTALGVGAALALRGAEAEEPAAEGAPEGQVSIDVRSQGRTTIPLGYVEMDAKIQGRSIRDVKGAWGVEAAVNVNGVCTAGFPAPDMVLELYDNDVNVQSLTVTGVLLGTPYSLPWTIGAIGTHTVYGRMVLTNPLGSYEFTSDPVTFDIGEVPPGDVDIDVTLTPG